MPFIGNKPSAVPLTSADIIDGIITSAKIADGTIVNTDINASSAIALSKLSTTGTADATTFLRGDGAYTAVSSDFVLLASTDASASATISFDGYFSSTYRNYQLVISQARPATNTNTFLVRYRRSNADVTASNYYSSIVYNYAYPSGHGASGGGTWLGSSANMTESSYVSSTASHGGVCSVVNIYNPLGTANYKQIQFSTGHVYGAFTAFIGGYGSVLLADSTSALSGLTFFFASGNITSGNFKLYGIK